MSRRQVVLAVALLVVVGCGETAPPTNPAGTKISEACGGVKTAAADGAPDTLTRLTGVYETCDGNLATHYVKGKVTIFAYAGNGREQIVGIDFTSGEVVNGWIVP